MEKKLFDVYFCETYYGYAWAVDARAAVLEVTGHDTDPDDSRFEAIQR